ncbi:hypothetical protein [Streptomyces ficellus]|uniref:hypothetical protein n=1 Tax=Streptomyces ficellus TaxID=1977088 RepID=UPI001FCB00D3|nr:hypothetical protein [Streptomyces ficellus]
MDSLTAFDAFGRRTDGGAGLSPDDGFGHQSGTAGHPAGTSAYAADGHGYPTHDGYQPDGHGYLADGTGYPADATGHGYASDGDAAMDETIAYRPEGHAPDLAAPDLADPHAAGPDFGTAELPAVAASVPADGTAPASPAAPVDAEPSDGPVFVDESGRRSKKFRRLGWVLATACAVYAITLVVSVIGGNSAAPWLLIPGPADEKKTETVQVEPAPSTSEAPKNDTPGAVPGAPAPTDSTGAVIPRPADGGPEGVPATPRPGTSSAPGATPPGTGTDGGTVVDDDKPDVKPTPGRPTDGGTTPQPPPVVPPDPVDPDPTDTAPTTPTDEPTDPQVGDSGGQQMAAEGAQ